MDRGRVKRALEVSDDTKEAVRALRAITALVDMFTVRSPSRHFVGIHAQKLQMHTVLHTDINVATVREVRISYNYRSQSVRTDTPSGSQQAGQRL